MSARPRSAEIRQATRVKKPLTPADNELLIAIARGNLAEVMKAVEMGADVNCISHHKRLDQECSAVYIAFKEHRANDALMDYLIKVEHAEPRNQAERDEMDLYYRLKARRELEAKQEAKKEAKQEVDQEPPPLPTSAPPPLPVFASPSRPSSPPPRELPPLPLPPVKTETKVGAPASALPPSPLPPPPPASALPSSPLPPPPPASALPSSPLPPPPPASVLPSSPLPLSPLPEEQKLEFKTPKAVSAISVESAQRGLSVDRPTYLEPNPLSAEIRARLSPEIRTAIDKRRDLEVIFVMITNNDNWLSLFENKSAAEIAEQVNVLGFVKFPDTSNRPQDLGNGPIKLLSPLQFAMTRNPVNRELLTLLIIKNADLSRLNDFELCQLYESFLVLGESIIDPIGDPKKTKQSALGLVHKEFERRKQGPMPADIEEQANRKHMLIRIAIYQNNKPDELWHLLMQEVSTRFENPSEDIELGYPTETIGLDGSRVPSNSILDILVKRREQANPFMVWMVLKALGKFEQGADVSQDRAQANTILGVLAHHLEPSSRRGGSQIKLPKHAAEDIIKWCERSGVSAKGGLSTAVASLPKDTPLHADVPSNDLAFQDALKSKRYPFESQNDSGFTPLQQQVKNCRVENVREILRHGPPLSAGMIRSLADLAGKEIEALQGQSRVSVEGLLGGGNKVRDRKISNLKQIVGLLQKELQEKVEAKVEQKADRLMAGESKSKGGALRPEVGAGGAAAAPPMFNPGNQQLLAAVRPVSAPASQPYSPPAAPKTREGEAKKGLAAAAAARQADSGPPRSPSRAHSSLSHGPTPPPAAGPAPSPPPPPLPATPPKPRIPGGGPPRG